MRHRTAVVVAVTITVVALVAFASPVGLALADLLWKPDWRHLADIGQAYGAASAVFSALAVAGVAAGLVYQARALRLARIQAIRSTRRELLTRAMEKPDVFAPAAGLKSWQATDMRPEQYWYATAFVDYLHSAFDAGIHTEESLRRKALPNFFAGELGRQWWTAAKGTWWTDKDPVTRRFVALVEQEYAKAVAAGPPLPRSAFRYQEPRRRGVAGAVGLVGSALVVGWLIGRRR